MPAQHSSSVRKSQTQLAYVLGVLALLVFIAGGYIWYSKIFTAPERVFREMVANSLNVRGVTREVSQDDTGISIKQRLRLELGGTNSVEGLTTLVQNDSANKQTMVVTETVGTPEKNFSRYVSVETEERNQAGKAVDLSPIENIWSQETVDPKAGTQGLFAEAMFGVIPFAQLSQANRKGVQEFIRENNVYDVEYEKAKRIESSGKSAYEYPVIVQAKNYIELLKRVDSLTGLNQLQELDSSAYENTTPIQLTIVVAIDSRQLLEVRYSGASRTEVFSGYGIQNNQDLPEAAVSRAELETQLQQLLPVNDKE